MTDSSQSHNMLMGLASAGGTKNIKRIALVVQNSRMSFTTAGLRELVPTFVVDSLRELRQALTMHHEGAIAANDDRTHTYPELIALDITNFNDEDLELFAGYLSTTSELGVVYVLTPKQFDIFKPGTFDFVVR